jgi:hypothetical protein
VALLVALAVWKPWESGASSARGPSVPPRTAASLVPAITSRPAGAAQPTPSTPPRAPTYAGLDLSLMGTVDRHDAWGVAVGYVSKEQFDIAANGAPIVTPLVSWQLIEPGRTSPGPIVDHSGGTSIAVAATWPTLPSATEPVSLRLFRSLPTDRSRSNGPSSKPRAGIEVQLQTTLDEVVGSGAGPTPSATLGSGRFFIPPALSEDVVAWPNTGWPASWPSHGWPAGAYEFQVDLADGDSVTLPFVIASGRAP